MGTYDELLKLNQAHKTNKPEKKPFNHKASLSTFPVHDLVQRKNPLPKSDQDTSHLLKATPQIQMVPSEQESATMIPRHHATVIPRYHDTIIGIIRAAVKQFSKDTATHQFTPEQKKPI